MYKAIYSKAHDAPREIGPFESLEDAIAAAEDAIAAAEDAIAAAYEGDDDHGVWIEYGVWIERV